MNDIILGALGVAAFIASCGLYSAYLARKRKSEGVQIEMIRARLMLLSSNPKEIQFFLEDKEPYLTQEMINQLINRIAEIKADEIIAKDWEKKVEKV